MGDTSAASGAGAVALGQGASASGANSVAIGAGASAANDGQVVVASLDDSTGSQTGGLFLVTADATGTLGLSGTGDDGMGAFAAQSSVDTNSANIAANSTAIGSLQQLTSTQTGQINTLFGQTQANREAIDRANEGVAMALAMESPQLPAGTTFALSGGVGYFENQGAGTMALSARVSDNASISAGVGVGFDSGEVGARGGFQFAW